MKKVFSLAAVCLLLAGCSERSASPENYEYPKIDITENKTSHFFATDNEFVISDADIEKLKQLLRDSKGEGIENIGFMIISDSPILKSQKSALTSQVKSLMIRAGFLESRIVDSGICIYKDAKKGIRVDVLKYDLNRTDTDLWTDSVGDCDFEKELPNYGKAMNYNMEEMVANSADLIAPRKYKGQRVTDALSAIGSTGTSSSSSSFSSSSSSKSSSK